MGACATQSDSSRARLRVPPRTHHAPATAPLIATETLGSGEPLVLIHGLATSRQIWSTVAPLLARSRRVVLLDVPGFGDSDPVGAGFTLERVADKVAAEVGSDAPYDLVGHSLGAGVALTLAARHPALVRRLVLVAPAGFAPLPGPLAAAVAVMSEPLLAARRHLAGLSDLSWGRRLLLGFAAAEPSRVSPTQARLIVSASASARRTGPALATITRADLRPLLTDVAAPIGVLWGTADRTIPVRTAEAIRAQRPDVEVAVIERAGHVLMIERPDEFAAALEELLARLLKDATTPARDRPTVS